MRPKRPQGYRCKIVNYLSRLALLFLVAVDKVFAEYVLKRSDMIGSNSVCQDPRKSKTMCISRMEANGVTRQKISTDRWRIAEWHRTPFLTFMLIRWLVSVWLATCQQPTARAIDRHVIVDLCFNTKYNISERFSTFLATLLENNIITGYTTLSSDLILKLFLFSFLLCRLDHMSYWCVF